MLTEREQLTFVIRVLMPDQHLRRREGQSLAGILLLLLSLSPNAQNATRLAQESKFNSKLREVRYRLRLEEGEITGAAAPVLAQAISSANTY